ncbi:hypothetical protein RB614_00855 [Phytohabitans sp. ZYX-F-186]|uniref:Uncharacterized protein n=1 Tax=Phytohabitans maris TaxID=3071409 RepID=A0ABU0Z9C5_9ACTN|nr:hypothetical protein [Phytohabitans sp. ZYX-F-186]MDQ7903069.1 hypothetical protein [Phytohabitans sp. ZYX-F-186]
MGLIIAIVVVVAAVAFGGWYVWDKNKDDKPANNSATNTNQGSQGEEQADPSEGGQYLVISEWGVRFELPEELKGDVKYGIFTSASGEQSANFAIGEIDRLPGSNCQLQETTDPGESGKYGGVVSMQRTQKPPTEISQELAVGYSSETHIGDQWYYVFSMRDACFSADQEEFSRLAGEIEKLAKAAESLQQVQ